MNQQWLATQNDPTLYQVFDPLKSISEPKRRVYIQVYIYIIVYMLCKSILIYLHIYMVYIQRQMRIAVHIYIFVVHPLLSQNAVFVHLAPSIVISSQ